MSRTEAESYPLTRKNKVGLVLAGLLGLIDLTNFASLPGGDSDTPEPPTAVLVAGGLLGLITIAAVIYTWRSANRTGSRVVAGSRILSAITALPALFVPGIPAWIVALAAVFVVVTVAVIGLVLSRPAPESVAT
jgi:hypothetical protein